MYEKIFELGGTFQKKNDGLSKMFSVRVFEKPVKSEIYQNFPRICLQKFKLFA